MWKFAILTLASAAASALAFPGVVLGTRDGLKESYDYIVVGGGMAGLTIAGRLSQSSKNSVLVVEAGPIPSPESEENDILFPAGWTRTFRYTWAPWDSLPIANFNNRSFSMQAAKVLGGGSTINGLNYNKAAPGDYDIWEAMGNKGWGWDSNMRRTMMKNEHFHPPDPRYAAENDIVWANRGTDGPIHSMYPPFRYPQIKAFYSALEGLGAPKTTTTLGRYWITSSMKPPNITRSYSKNEFNDPALSRTNYYLLTGQTVTRVLFKNKRAIGVEYSTGPGEPKRTILAKKEVIISCGALFSPKLLLLSGVGEKRKLESLGISVVADNPGVGRNFQDHARFNFQVTLTLNREDDPAELQRNATFYNEMLEIYRTNHTGPLTLTVGSSTATLPLSFFTNESSSILSRALIAPPAANLPLDTPPSVARGYAKQRKLLLSSLQQNKVAAASFLQFLDATPSVGLIRPLSRGVVSISSNDPFAPPVVDYRSLSDPYDRAVIVAGIRYARRIISSPAMAPYNPVERSPGPEKQSDAELEEAIRDLSVPTFAHPMGTTAMGKFEDGAVVDEKLRVHGVTGLRVVDAGVMVTTVGAGPMASIYGIAERAAEIILRGE